MPPTRREQLELDELLSDIYRGIETLPDNYSGTGKINQLAPGGSVYSRSDTRQYELPASSPLVKQHKQELAALREVNSSVNNLQAANKKPQRSTLKRNTNTPQQQHQQSLAPFAPSTTPDNKRRVRIVDHPDKFARDFSGFDDNDNDYRQGGDSKSKVKYVNTNKLIYHQEHNRDDPVHDSVWVRENNIDESKQADYDDDDDNDIDGATRVEYYHTTWLDRQLGRASKRRSSKEVNERQVKEKAMIEELKQSLKNGAITLRKSFKGKRSANKNKHGETYDDQMLDSPSTNRVKTKNSTVFGSGLATIPRNYHQQHSNKFARKQESFPVNPSGHKVSVIEPTQQPTSSNYNTLGGAPVSTSGYNTSVSNNHQPQQQASEYQQEQKAHNYSRTLPHNYQANRQQTQGTHQLLQSHYRTDKSFNNNPSFNNTTTTQHQPINTLTPSANPSDTMRNVHYSTIQCSNNNGYNSSNNNTQTKNPIQVNQQSENTISSIPSASEVVRSALSRSNSQISLNQLNKTINLLPNSPPPYANHSPMTPTQQLKPATPSLSPSPTFGTMPHQRQQQQYPSQNLYNQTHAASPNVASDYGSRTWSASTSQQQQQSGIKTQQPVYANPHASLMQHKMEQQMTKPSGRNTASIREFNELDSLLRSLSPASTRTTQVTPGYTSRPTQPSFGFGPAPVAAGPIAGDQQTNRPNADIYARVQKQQPHVPSHQVPQAGGFQQQHSNNVTPVGTNFNAHQDFTVNVSDKKDENCLKRQELSEFEPPVELLPSMEDYQNISKLNPVKNHYWYKPNMSRDRAISLLKDKPQGTFIVRDSTSFRGAYGLAVKVSKLPKNVLNNVNLRNPNADPSSELIRHFLIEPTSNGVRLKGYANEPVFGSLPSLIYQHSLTELALPCKLVIPRADIEDPKFNQRQKQFYDEFLASKEQFKHSPYERTSPNGGYRKYPGDVYVHNEHRIIFE